MYQALSAVREDDTERTKRRASPGKWQPEGSGCGLNFVQINTVSIIIKSQAAKCEFGSRYSGSILVRRMYPLEGLKAIYPLEGIIGQSMIPAKLMVSGFEDLLTMPADVLFGRP